MRPIERVLLLIGVLSLAWVGSVYLSARVDEAQQNEQLDAARTSPGGPTAGDIHLPAMRTAFDERPVAPARASRIEGSMIGRVEVPRLGVSAIVREGVESGTLRRAVGHVPETALPGEPGNVALAAHRDTHFSPLRRIRRGDRVRIVTADGEHEYRVAATRIVKPEDVSVLDPTPTPTLTLITCYPFNFVGSAPHRFIVRAEAITPPAATRAAVATTEVVVARPLLTASPVTKPHMKQKANRGKPKIVSKARAGSAKAQPPTRKASVQKDKPKAGWKKFIGAFKPKARPRAGR